MKQYKKHKVLTKLIFLITLPMLISVSCMKEFLDVKQNKAQVIPSALEDFQSILENQVMNYFSPHQLCQVGSDEYFLKSQQWHALASPVFRNGYIWADEIYEGEASEDWNRGYEKILYANFVIEGVSDIQETVTNKLLRDEIAGSSHFFRGLAFFNLAQLFCKQYDSETASKDLGLPLRISSNINLHYSRATLKDTYELIIKDLKTASLLLPKKMSLNTRPYQAAALVMLANVYLQMGDFENSLHYADKAKVLIPELIDYNIEVDSTLPTTFPLFGRDNKEVIFFSLVNAPTSLLNTNLNVDSSLFVSYEEEDLRKGAFFFVNDGRNVFKGSYSGTPVSFFTGLTSAELLLVRAECNARLENIKDAVEDINLLLSNRYKKEFFHPISEDINQEDLLTFILSHRRKELIFRGRRWHDLRRLSKDPVFAQSIKRKVDGEEFTLPLESPKWVWPIPPDVINLSGIQQNER